MSESLEPAWSTQCVPELQHMSLWLSWGSAHSALAKPWELIRSTNYARAPLQSKGCEARGKRPRSSRSLCYTVSSESTHGMHETMPGKQNKTIQQEEKEKKAKQNGNQAWCRMPMILVLGRSKGLL